MKFEIGLQIRKSMILIKDRVEGKNNFFVVAINILVTS